MSNHTPLKKKHIPRNAITLFFANLEGFYLAETVLLVQLQILTLIMSWHCPKP